MAAVRRKLVIVGDKACGKTSLRFRFTGSLQDYSPTVVETQVITIKVDGIQVQLVLPDTGGQEDCESFRSVSYKDSDVVLICFAIDNPQSLTNIRTKWSPELRRHCPGVPIILVGNKKDLRGNANSVTQANATAVQNEIGAAAYVECSADTGEQVQDALKIAIQTTL